MSELIALSNAGTVELLRVLTNLYAKKLITKDQLKEFRNSLNYLIEKLPDHEETYLQ